ncbi:MAG: inorganic diphosphatase [Gammaproteobacteria bacterium]
MKATPRASGPEVEVVIEIPRWSFLKRGSSGQLDFLSPLPCPFNYGSVPDRIGLEGDLLDAVVLGPRLPRNACVKVRALGAVGLSDRGLYDDKLICSSTPISRSARTRVLAFFWLYGLAKRLLNVYRRRPGLTRSQGWVDAEGALARSTPRGSRWEGPRVSF